MTTREDKIKYSRELLSTMLGENLTNYAKKKPFAFQGFAFLILAVLVTALSYAATTIPLWVFLVSAGAGLILFFVILHFIRQAVNKKIAKAQELAS